MLRRFRFDYPRADLRIKTDTFKLVSLYVEVIIPFWTMVPRKRLRLLRSVAWKVKFSGSRLRWLLWTSSCLIIRQFLELKTSFFSANCWRANLFFPNLFLCDLFFFLMVFFLCVDEVLTFPFWSPFSFNKITDFHLGFLPFFVFEDFFWFLVLNVLPVFSFYLVIDQAVVDFYMRSGRSVYLSVLLVYSRLSSFCRIL